MKLTSKIKSWFGSGVEGSYKGPAIGISEWGNAFPIQFGDGYQSGLDILDRNNPEMNTTVESCVSTISQTVAMLPVHHYREKEGGGNEIITTSAASRILRKPNPYQTKSDFFLGYTRALLLRGNAYSVATRNNRHEIDALYPQNMMEVYVSKDYKDVYYSSDDDILIDFKPDRFIPSRDIYHTRLNTKEHPLVGVSPLTAMAISAMTGNSIQGHENRFFTNMARPSGVISTDMQLSGEQTKELRKRFNENSQGMNTGGTTILTNGLKFQQISMSAIDSEIIETYKMTKMDIASVYRVPMPLIGSMDSATFNNVEALYKFWISGSLGFLLDHLEEGLHELFNLPPDEFINFDTDYLLRSDFQSRIDGFAKGVQGGVYTPNEVRAKEGLSSKPNGDDIYLQAQMVRVGTPLGGEAEPVADEELPTESMNTAERAKMEEGLEKAFATL